MSSKKKKSNRVEVNKTQTTQKEFNEIYYPIEHRPQEERSVSKNPIWLILCFLIPFIFVGVCFALNESIPFGDKTVFYGDFKAQYYPFLKDLQNKLQNGGSLLWTWNSGLGSNFIGMIGYYLSSPMYLLLAFVPAKYLIIGITVCLMAKFGIAGLFSGIFLKKLFRRNDISIVAFSLGYAFSNFMMGYYWNIIWLDTVALLPLVALGVYQLVYEKKYKLYVISLALALISNYYIGYMLCVFTLIWFFILWAKYPKTHRTFKGFKNSFISIAVYTVLALSLTAFLIVPSYLQLQNSGSTNDTGLDKVEVFHSFFDVLGQTLGFHNATKIEADGLPNLYGGVICIVLFIIFARCSKISRAEKIADLSFIGFVFLSLNWSPLDFMWHGFHEPNQIPSRFAFIFIFLMLLVSYRAFTLLKYVKSIDLIVSVFFAGFVLLSGYACEIDILYSVVFIAAYLVFIWLYELKVYNEKILVSLISVLMIVEMCINCKSGVEYLGNTKAVYDNDHEIAVLLDEIQEKDTDFYRLEETYVNSKNDGMWHTYHGMGQFSSTVNKNVLEMYGQFGMTRMKLSFQTYHTSPVITSFFNLKYYIARNNGYNAKDPTLTAVAREGKTTLYRYKYFLPLGFAVEKDLADLDIKKYNSNAIDSQNSLFSTATGIKEDVFTRIYANEYTIDDGDLSTNNVESGKFSYKTSGKDKVATIKYIADKKGEYYAYVNVRDDSKRATVKSKSINHTYDVDSKRYLMPIGYYDNGDEIEFNIKLTERTNGSFEIFVAHFDEETFAKGYELLNDEPMNVTYYDDTTVQGTITAKEDTLLYTSIPYEDGWTVYVDGKKAEKLQLIEGFSGVEITAGKHEIEFKYCPKGLLIGVAITILGLIIFIAICVIEYLKKKQSKGSVIE